MRLVYENAKNAVVKAFPDVPQILNKCKLTQSDLRLEQPVVVGNTLYKFPVLINEALFSNTEKRLLQQDSAVVYQIGLMIGKPASAVDTAWLPQTYPNSVVFTNAAPMNAIYNGSVLSVAVNNDILVPNWECYKHLNVPQTQATAAANSPQAENRGAHDGFYPMEPNIVLIGSKNNVIELKLPVGVTATDANARIILILRCIIAQNSTVVS